MDYEKLSYVLRAKTRKKVVMIMDRIRMPSELKKELKIEDSNIARALRELEKANLIKCLTPKQKMGKLFTLTAEGEKIRKEIKGKNSAR